MHPLIHPGTHPAATLRHRLEELQRERSTAVLNGLAAVRPYLDDLEAELAATEAAYVAVAVTELASLRAALGAPLEG